MSDNTLAELKAQNSTLLKSLEALKSEHEKMHKLQQSDSELLKKILEKLNESASKSSTGTGGSKVKSGYIGASSPGLALAQLMKSNEQMYKEVKTNYIDKIYELTGRKLEDWYDEMKTNDNSGKEESIWVKVFSSFSNDHELNKLNASTFIAIRNISKDNKSSRKTKKADEKPSDIELNE